MSQRRLADAGLFSYSAEVSTCSLQANRSVPDIRIRYTVVSPKVIACLVGAILYMLNKKDLIPDYIPIIGIADDLAVMGLALKLSEPELKAFAEWRDQQQA